eukprot:14282384-Alexandrium_andersonii.AAC.1
MVHERRRPQQHPTARRSARPGGRALPAGPAPARQADRPQHAEAAPAEQQHLSDRVQGVPGQGIGALHASGGDSVQVVHQPE